MIRCEVTDLLETSGTDRIITAEGFLKAPAHIARTGYQEYLASELGMDESHGYDAKRIVRLMRPAEEVYAKETVDSFDGQTMTLGHPSKDKYPQGVTAKDWKALSIGDFSRVRPATPYLDADVVIRDASAVRAVIDGTKQMSCGYSFDLDLTPTPAADGVMCDGVMRRIRGNHCAIVDRARGGPGCRIADGQLKDEGEPTMRTLKIGDVEIQVDEKEHGVIDSAIKILTNTLTTARDSAVAEARTAKDQLGVVQKKLTDLETAKDQLVKDHAAALKVATDAVPTADAIEQLVEQRTTVIEDALVLVPGLKAAGKTVEAIRTEVVSRIVADDSAATGVVLAVLGLDAEDGKLDEKIKKADAPKITAAFAVARAALGAGDADTRRARTRAQDRKTADGLLGDRRVDNASDVADQTKPRGRDAMKQRMKSVGAGSGVVVGEEADA